MWLWGCSSDLLLHALHIFLTYADGADTPHVDYCFRSHALQLPRVSHTCPWFAYPTTSLLTLQLQGKADAAVTKRNGVGDANQDCLASMEVRNCKQGRHAIWLLNDRGLLLLHVHCCQPLQHQALLPASIIMQLVLLHVISHLCNTCSRYSWRLLQPLSFLHRCCSMRGWIKPICPEFALIGGCTICWGCRSTYAHSAMLADAGHHLNHAVLQGIQGLFLLKQAKVMRVAKAPTQAAQTLVRLSLCMLGQSKSCELSLPLGWLMC